ncbi:MAG: N-acetyltransferase [Chloroflexi bacterium]|nr:N-acetyltransferase [Chloroflexota bacterium]
MQVQPAPRTNALGQPIGAAVEGWSPRAFPARSTMQGRTCRLEPFDVARHADDLIEAFAADREGRTWTYLPYGPFASPEAHRAQIAAWSSTADPQFYAIIDEATGRAIGQASYLRIDPANGVIEVGHLAFSPALQRTTASTEAMYLMMRRAFEEYGYRRYEWKCDSHNVPSWITAERLGFTFEGTFRQAVVVKGRNRDTTWLSVTDAEWPSRRDALEAWLAPHNFDAQGQQRRSLLEFQRESGAR